ncbi:MAG: penicillin-binding transpeptidase domain-containing protein [Anaerolineaceae bacterium]|nr:penicillin-binding transpeptidase domain-containing protein [Anaerolineaceae bacterium]
MKKSLLALMAFIILLGGCVKTTPSPSADVTETAPTSLPTPKAEVNSKYAEVDAFVRTYLTAWKGEYYADMYSMLSQETKASLSEEDFEKRHRNTYDAMTLKSLEIEQLSSMVTPGSSAQVALKLYYATNLFGNMERDSLMDLSYEDHGWKVKWNEGMLMNELKGGNSLYIDYQVPARGNIYDSKGYAMVSQSEAVSLGVVPERIDPKTETEMLSLLSTLTGYNADRIKDLYANANPTWYIPVGDVAADKAKQYAGQLASFAGIVLNSFKARYYVDGGLAPHSIGYVQPIFAEKLEYYKRLGYRGDEKIGTSGLELWGERYLAGEHGATLYVKDPSGKTITMLAQKESVPASSLFTTIDARLQYLLQNSMGNLRGAIVVIERDSGRIPAIVSNPPFNPNIFEPTNENNRDLTRVFNDPAKPLLNRATQGVYPLGSVFKIITMAAALETGVFQKDSSYYCGSDFTELDGWVGHDWTWAHKMPPSGTLTLQGALMRSCNPWFWHIGKVLWDDGYTTSIYDEAFGFGLGQKTGVEVAEDAGNLSKPQSVSENVQLSIGQSTLQASPIQVARYIAAVGNGGTLYKPSLIEKIVPVDGTTPIYTFTPTPNGTLPITHDNLMAVQQAMVSVVANKDGTAIDVTRPMTINIAGKTGTAENPLGDSHAWFGGYTWKNDPNRPDIAIGIVLENAGEGSQMAAPLFRRAVELYFNNYNISGYLMPWEDKPYHQAQPEATTD